MRRARGWTIKEGAATLGVDESTLGNWERGKTILYRAHPAPVVQIPLDELPERGYLLRRAADKQDVPIARRDALLHVPQFVIPARRHVRFRIDIGRAIVFFCALSDILTAVRGDQSSASKETIPGHVPLS